MGTNTIGGVVALSVEYRTCDQEVVGSSLGRARGEKSLGPVCLSSPKGADDNDNDNDNEVFV